MPEQRITVGRVVHYYPELDPDDGAYFELRSEQEPVAAITCGVGFRDPMTADLFVMDPDAGAEIRREVEFSEEPEPGHWTWQPVQRTQRPDVGAPR